MGSSLSASMIGTGGTPSNPPIAGDQDDTADVLQFDPGELAAYPDSPFSPLELDEQEGNAVDALCDLVGNKDVAARRWEVEQSWEHQLMRRGYQYLLPRRGGGWILPPFATDYQSGSGRGRAGRFYGYETNITATYEEIMEAALTRDIPEVRGEPFDPMSDADITASHRFSEYARIFASQNDLLTLHHQIAWYLSVDGRVALLTDHIVDANRFGRTSPQDLEPGAVPEAQDQQPAQLYLMRHGETEMNAANQARGHAEIGIDDRGARQAQAAADWLRGKNVPAIVSSPVQRALESADIVGQTTGAPITTDDRFASLDVGSLEGEPSSAVTDEIDQNGPGAPIGGGESLDEFNRRVRDGFTDIARTAPQGTVLVVHDSVISSIYKMLHGEDVPAGSLVRPGGIAAVCQQPDGTMTVGGVFPYTPPPLASGQSRGRPRGAEITRAFGKLQTKVPMGTQEFCDMGYVQISYEVDVAMARAMFPDCADKIVPGQRGAGENELDRIARINATLALEASYVTGDSMVRDCTLQQTWFRPGFLMDIADKEVRARLLKKCPDGMRVIHAGRTRVLVRNENMDDHLCVFQAFPGAGQNRLALGTKLISIQKRLNNWVDLMNAYYIRTVPNRVFDSDIFDPEALRKQTSDPGSWIPYSGTKLADRPPEAAASGLAPIWVEPTPTHQPSMPEFIKMFIQDLPQLLTGAVPSLFGSASNTDTVGGITIQRDQALGRLGTPWHAIQMATCTYFRQAVQLAARCRTEPIRGMVNNHSVQIELADLRGQVLVRPEVDANFPESWNQQQQRYQQMLQDATNPLVAKVLSNPANLLRAQQLFAIPGFKIKDAQAYEQQLGEFDALLRGEPVPNPQFDAQKSHILAMQQALAATQANGVHDPEMQQVIDGAIKMLQKTPELLPSFQIGPKDNDSVHSSACEDWYNGPEGRRMRNGTQEERAKAQNVLLHWQQHDARTAEAAAQQPPQPPKPLSLTANIKDLPPADAAVVLQRAGLPSTPEGMAQGRELDAQIRKSGRVE